MEGPVFEISALTREGCEALIHAIYRHVQSEQRWKTPLWKWIHALLVIRLFNCYKISSCWRLLHKRLLIKDP